MSLRYVLSTGGLAALGLLALGAPASAHVNPSIREAPAGSYAKFELRVPHGCDGASTTMLEVQIPEGITSVTPQVVPGWTIERTIVPLDPPLDDGHGGHITERTSVITWTGGPLAHDHLEEFGLSVKLPDTPGETLAFPSIQTCEGGASTSWIQIPEEGGEEPEHPAPTITLTEAIADGPGPREDVEDADPAAATADDTDTDAATPLAVTGIVLGAAGLALGGQALRKSRAVR